MRIHPELDRLGLPLEDGGALYYATGIGGLVEAAADMSAARASSQGFQITVDNLAQFREQAEQQKREHLRIVEGFGIPDNIRSLVSAKSQKEAERLSANFTITENDLFLMIHNCHQLGFSSRNKHPNFVPPHLQITDIDGEEFKDRRLEKMPRKISNLLKERKVINVHLLENREHWHCFFFTYSDLDDGTKNHWQGGPHLHYVSHVWQSLKPDVLWESLDKQRDRASSGFHIKFNALDWPTGNQSPSESFNEMIFPTDLNVFSKSPPIPLAVLLIYGFWMASIRIF